AGGDAQSRRRPEALPGASRQAPGEVRDSESNHHGGGEGNMADLSRPVSRKHVGLPTTAYFLGAFAGSTIAVLLEASTLEGGESTLGTTFGIYVGSFCSVVSAVAFAVSLNVLYCHPMSRARIGFSAPAGCVTMLLALLFGFIAPGNEAEQQCQE